MKVTSLEISKKLAEIGFSAPYSFVRFSEGGCAFVAINPHKLGGIPAYDLETILEALNADDIKIDGSGITANYRPLFESPSFQFDEIFEELKENESLATCAARLFLKIHATGNGHLRQKIALRESKI